MEAVIVRALQTMTTVSAIQVPASRAAAVSCNSLLLERPRTRRTRSAVQFGHVEIHEFPPAIGHNPSVTAGVPITLGDRPIKSLNYDLQDYEHHRRGQRRTTRQMHLPKEIREEMLLAEGFERTEIVQAIRAARVGRTQRKQSNDSRAIVDAVEEARRKLKRMMKGAKHSQQQPQGPSPLKLGPTNADLKCRFDPNPAYSTIQSDNTLTCESSASTFCSDDLPKLLVRDDSGPFEMRKPKPMKRTISHDSLPKMPKRFSLKAQDSSGSESEDDKRGGSSNMTTLRDALALKPRESTSGSDAPKLPARRISDKSKSNDALLSDACRLVEALDVVNAMVQRQEAEESCRCILHSQEVRLNKPPLDLCLSPSTGEATDEDEDEANKESSFWHSYPTEQAPQAPRRAMRSTPSPSLDTECC